MIKIAISFALGCALLFQFSHIPSMLWLWLALPTCILLRFKYLRYFSLVLLGGLWALFYSQLVIDNRILPELEGQDITISGIIASVPEVKQRRVRFEFSLDSSPLLSLPSKIRLNWYTTVPLKLTAGERWNLTVRLKSIHGMMNSGSFDYENWLFQKNIGAIGYVRHSADNQRLEPTSAYSLNALRQSLVNNIEAALPHSANVGVIQGLTTGIRHNITQDKWQVLRLTGTSHLLAISGLHIGLATAIGFFIFRFLWRLQSKNLLLLTATEAGVIGGFIFALFYASLAGFSIPTQRALIMVTTVMIALIIRRPINPSHILAVSLAFILLLSPLSVLSPGFWLSFSAVGIILFISQHRYPTPKWQWAKIHFLIAFGLSPLLLLFFSQTSLISPFANFISIPFVSLLIVPLLLLSSLLLWAWPTAGVALLHLTDTLLNMLFPMLEIFSSLPFSHWLSPPLPFYYWLSIILGCLILLLPRGFPAKWLGIIGFLPLFFSSTQKPEQGDFYFTLLDVGQGLSAVIQTQNHTLVFDTGPKFSDNFNTGTAIVKPFLQQRGIQKIDTLIVSHGDNDHIGGALPLINAIPTLTVLSSAPQLLPNAKHCRAGQTWQWDNVIFSLLHPDSNDDGSENNQSCVLHVSNSGGSVLLTGDIELETEKLLVQRYGPLLHTNVLVAPHHGSKTSSSLNFIKAVKPDIALFPIGYRNRYHFPHHDVVDRYNSQNIKLFNSAKHGEISIKFGATSYAYPQSWRQTNHKIWTAN